MIVQCAKCRAWFDDEFLMTVCKYKLGVKRPPWRTDHALIFTNDGANKFSFHAGAFWSMREPLSKIGAEAEREQHQRMLEIEKAKPPSA